MPRAKASQLHPSPAEDYEEEEEETFDEDEDVKPTETQVKSSSSSQKSSAKRKSSGKKSSDDGETLTQKKKNTLNRLSLEQQMAKISAVVRLFVFKGVRSTPITKQEIRDQLGEYSSLSATIVEQATSVLETVFGMTVVELPAADKPAEPPLAQTEMLRGELVMSKTNIYVLKNKLSVELTSAVIGIGNDLAIKGLLMTVLALIYMKGHEISQVVLWKCLEDMGLGKSTKHAVLGDVQQLVEKTFVNERYLKSFCKVETEGRRITYRWGQHARAELTERDVVNFLAKAHGDNPALVWARIHHGQPAAAQADEGEAAAAGSAPRRH